MLSYNEIIGLFQQGRMREASDAIVQALNEGADFSKQAVALGHLMTLSAPWVDSARLIPAARNHLFSSGWLNSLAKGRPINASDQPVPWITYAAIDFLDGIVKPEWNVFEWGSGNSTLWWSSRVKSVKAAESCEGWYNEISHKMPANVNLVSAPEKQAYLDAYMANEGKLYDVVVIDGDHRNDCARIAMEKLAPGGIIIFDNTDGEAMDEGVAFLGGKDLYRLDFWGLIPSYLYKNCTSIYLSDASILRKVCLPSQHVSSIGLSCQQHVDMGRKKAKA